MSDPEKPKYVRLFRLAILFDDVEALDELAAALDTAAAEFKRMVKSGKVWVVPDTLDEGEVELGTDSPRVAEAFGFEDASELAESSDLDFDDLPDPDSE